jgi:hypothetical protein
MLVWNHANPGPQMRGTWGTRKIQDGARGQFLGQEQLSMEFPTETAVSHRRAGLQ